MDFQPPEMNEAPAEILPADPGASKVELLCKDKKRRGRLVMLLEKKDDFESLSSNERILVCGTLNANGGVGGWDEIPDFQAQYLLKNFLAERGFYAPRFSSSEGALWIGAGPQTRITSWKTEGVPDDLAPRRYRGWEDQVLNGPSMDRMEDWMRNRLQRQGYPCSEITTVADPKTGAIETKVHSGQKQIFPVPELAPPSDNYSNNIFRRHDSFQYGSRLDALKLELARSRSLQEGLLVHSSFSWQCETPFLIQESYRVGDPRLVRIGAGFSTEEIPILQVTFRNLGLGKEGSYFETQAYGSSLRQRLKASYRAFGWVRDPRAFFESAVQVEHIAEKNLGGYRSELGMDYGKSWEKANGTYDFRIGPAFSFQWLSEGQIQNQKATSILVNGTMTYSDHDFQIFQSRPRTGRRWTFGFQSQTPFVLDLNLDPSVLFLASYTEHFELEKVDPHIWVLGVRAAMQSVFTLSGSTLIPAQFAATLGGDQDMRGYSRRELPGQGNITKTSVYLGFELRAANVLPLDLEPFSFLDLGSLGARFFMLEFPLYGSGGLGLRWNAGFGTLRLTGGHGFTLARDRSGDPAPHFQFFLSFGKEF